MFEEGDWASPIHLEKAIGPQQTTIASTLFNLTLASRCAVAGEAFQTTMEIILRFVQGQPTIEQCNFREAVTFFVDKGYVTEKSVRTCRKSRLHVAGTQKGMLTTLSTLEIERRH